MIYSQNNSQSISSGSLVKVCTLNVPAGLYIVSSTADYQDNNINSRLELKTGNTVIGASSGYDSYGWGAQNVGAIIEVNSSTDIDAYAKCSKSVNVTVSIVACSL